MPQSEQVRVLSATCRSPPGVAASCPGPRVHAGGDRVSNVRTIVSARGDPRDARSLRGNRNRGDTHFQGRLRSVSPSPAPPDRPVPPSQQVRPRPDSAGWRSMTIESLVTRTAGRRTRGGRPRGTWRSPRLGAPRPSPGRAPAIAATRGAIDSPRSRSIGARRIRRARTSSSDSASSRSAAQAISASRNGCPSTSGRTRSCSRPSASDVGGVGAVAVHQRPGGLPADPGLRRQAGGQRVEVGAGRGAGDRQLGGARWAGPSRRRRGRRRPRRAPSRR